MKLQVHRSRAETVLDELVLRYRTSQYPYNTRAAVLPQSQEHLPSSLPRGGLDEANFLWCLCYYMRGVIDSISAVTRLGRLYEAHPDLFVPQLAAQLSQETIRTRLIEHRLPDTKTIAKTWSLNAQRLTERWGGDPRQIFAGISDYEAACVRIQSGKKDTGFMGFQEKMVSMIIYFLSYRHMIEGFPFPIPVDFHVLRTTIAHEMVTFTGIAEDENLFKPALLVAARKLYLWYSQTHGVTPLELCDTIWIYSRIMCQYNPGNASTVIREDPEGNRLVARAREVNAIPVTWSTGQRNSYSRSCGHCAVRSTCSWNIPAGMYYVQGKLIRRGRRLDDPQIRLFEPADSNIRLRDVSVLAAEPTLLAPYPHPSLFES